jgi:anti-anti-sigma factor
MAGQAATSGSIVTMPRPDATVVRLAGEIDGTRRDEASQALSTSLRRQLPVVLDTEEVTFIDSTGLAFLIQCGSVGRSQGIPVSMPRPPAEVSDLLTLLGAQNLFDDAPEGGEVRQAP